MHFTSYLFFFFLGIVIPLYYLIPQIGMRKVFILLCSVIFYSVWDVRFVLLIFGTTAIDLFAGWNILKNRNRKFFLVTSLLVNLSVLFFFKYFNFGAGILRTFLLGRGYYWAPLDIALPVGLSFYTFQAMSFTVDCYKGKIKEIPSGLSFFSYITFFPHLVAGPIVRASDFLPQLTVFNSLKSENLNYGFYRIATGLFKKLVLSVYFASLSDGLFSKASMLNGYEVVIAGMAFGMQIFFDFSAYSDIAIGTARLFGYEFHENFNFPYAATGPSDFWRRWHISLSSWLRYYLYIPLGGNRGARWKKYYNSMLTMLLGGFWHGANWTFVLWGLLHGLALNVSYFFVGKREGTEEPSRNSSSGLLMAIGFFLLVAVTWIPFRAPNLTACRVMFQRLAVLEPANLSRTVVLQFFGILLLGPVLHYFADRKKILQRFEANQNTVLFLTLASLILTWFLHGESREFIYFQF